MVAAARARGIRLIALTPIHGGLLVSMPSGNVAAAVDGVVAGRLMVVLRGASMSRQVATVPAVVVKPPTGGHRQQVACQH